MTWWCSQHKAEEEAAEMGKLGVSASRVGGFFQTYLHPPAQWVERKFLVPVNHPETGTHMMPTTPWCLTRTADEDVRYSPLFGEHSAEVLQQELSIGPAECKLRSTCMQPSSRLLGEDNSRHC